MTIDSNIWTALGTEKLTPAGIVTRPVLPELTGRMLAAMDYNRRRHFLLLLKPEDVEYKDDSSRGLSVSTRELHGGAEMASGRYLDIECKEASGHLVFDLIGGELTETLKQLNVEPIEAVSQVLTRWRRFWGQVPQNILSREDLIGLFGEVWFLTNWLIPLVGRGAVDAWKGPSGGRHDFQWETGSVEVKSTTSIRGRVHHINGLDQLDPPDNGPLYFFSIRLREEVAATNTLPSIIELCSRRLDGATAALDTFETTLAKAHYSPAHAGNYATLHLRIVEEALFEVRHGFPRLGRENLAGGLPGGIENVGYVVNLNTFDSLCVAKIPEEAGTLQTMIQPLGNS